MLNQVDPKENEEDGGGEHGEDIETLKPEYPAIKKHSSIKSINPPTYHTHGHMLILYVAAAY